MTGLSVAAVTKRCTSLSTEEERALDARTDAFENQQADIARSGLSGSPGLTMNARSVDFRGRLSEGNERSDSHERMPTSTRGSRCCVFRSAIPTTRGVYSSLQEHQPMQRLNIYHASNEQRFSHLRAYDKWRNGGTKSDHLRAFLCAIIRQHCDIGKGNSSHLDFFRTQGFSALRDAGSINAVIVQVRLFARC